MTKNITIIISVVLALFITGCTSNASISTNSALQKTVKESEPKLKEAAEMNVQLAVGYIQRKQYNAARGKLEKAIKQNPNNVDAYKTLAYLYALLGMKDEAETKYQEALELKPEDPDLSNFYGTFLCSIGKNDEAQEKFQVAYSNPFYESAYLAESNAGSCYVEQGEYAKAEPLLRRSLRINPKIAGSLISMAEIGIKTDRFLMARAYIQRYHDASKPTAASLWVQIQAEKALGANDHYVRYARQLIREFPDSDEAGWVEAEARHLPLR